MTYRAGWHVMEPLSIIVTAAFGIIVRHWGHRTTVDAMRKMGRMVTSIVAVLIR